MNLQACTIDDTLQLVKVHKIQSHFVCGNYWNISINLRAYLTIFLPHTLHSMPFLEKHLAFFPQKPMAMQFPPKVRKAKRWEPRVELIRLSDVISQD